MAWRMITGVLAALSLVGAAEAAPPSYPLTCRGGPAMRIMVNHDVNSAGIPGATAMFLYFKPAAGAGSAAPPGPGECAWADRAFRPGEPKVLWIKSSRIQFAFQVLGSGQIVRDTTGPRLNVEGATHSPEAGGWDSIVKAVLTGQPFTVQAASSGSVLAITHIGP